MRAVLKALPSTHDPEVMPVEELRALGRSLYPEGMRLSIDADAEMREVVKIVWETLAKGFLLAAPYAMPYWMYKIMEMKQEGVDDGMLDAMWHVINGEREPIRQAKQWICLCQGHTVDEAIDNQMHLEVSFAVEAVIDDRKTERDVTPFALRCQALEDE